MLFFCQEHWLSPDLLYKIDALSADYVCFSKSGMETAVAGGVLTGRPFDGLSILVHNRFASRAKSIALEHRFIATLIDNLLLVNVYLPSCDNTEEYRSTLMDILCAIGEVIDQHQNVRVVIGGDFNFFYVTLNRVIECWLNSLMSTDLHLCRYLRTVLPLIVIIRKLFSIIH